MAVFQVAVRHKKSET